MPRISEAVRYTDPSQKFDATGPSRPALVVAAEGDVLALLFVRWHTDGEKPEMIGDDRKKVACQKWAIATEVAPKGSEGENQPYWEPL